MGRLRESKGYAPPSIRKETRAKLARQIVNKRIPALLASNARARRGVESSELIVDPEHVHSRAVQPTVGEPRRLPEPQYIKRKGQGRRKAKNTAIDNPNSNLQTHDENSKLTPDRLEGTNAPLADALSSPPIPTIRIIAADTLMAAHLLRTTAKLSRKEPNICILNMASPLRPGGGVLAGATSQEESLCLKTTLLPSLQESFYRLPEYGGVFTRDVLVFGSHASSAELASAEYYFVDVISAAMLRFPDLLGGEGEEKRLSKTDVLKVERKMRAVLRIARNRGVKRIILGAWGCGAYGNPTSCIAEAWQKVLGGIKERHGRKTKSAETVESWGSITEVVFAISSKKMAQTFGEAFDPRIEIEYVHNGQSEDESHHADQVTGELRSKIQEMEDQLDKVWNPDLKQRMGIILDELRTQLRERESQSDGQQNDRGDEGEDVSPSVDEEGTSDYEDSDREE